MLMKEPRIRQGMRNPDERKKTVLLHILLR
jgi:hypothetical protein